MVPKSLRGKSIIPLATRIINVTGIEPTRIIEHATKISLLSTMVNNGGNIYFKITLSNLQIKLICYKIKNKIKNLQVRS